MDQEKRACRTIGVLQWWGRHQHPSFGGLNSRDENPECDLVAVSGNGDFLVIFLLKTLFGIGPFLE
jgi:hypothetical protein